MRSMRLIVPIAALTLILAIGCGQQRANNPSVKNNVESALDQAGLKNINVDEDRSKGVITLKGDVASVAPGRILGHEGIGVIETVGRGVARLTGRGGRHPMCPALARPDGARR